MKKNISVILTKTTPNLGKIGNIINVTSGYAFNYLIPNKIASIASKGALKHNKMLADIEDKRNEKIRTEAKKLKQDLEYISKISIKKKMGENENIFGSINSKEIIEEILNSTGLKLEKKQIKLPEIKKVGIYTISIQIANDIIIKMKLQILPIDI